jgi:hypothetical protein
MGCILGRSGVGIPGRVNKFTLQQNIKTGSEAHPALYSVVTEKEAGREVYELPPSRAKVRNEWSYTPTPPIRVRALYAEWVPIPLIY